MVSQLMCPHCGWCYDPSRFDFDTSPRELVPFHSPESKVLIVGLVCPGSHQHPRNPETDRRPLWKDLPKSPPENS